MEDLQMEIKLEDSYANHAFQFIEQFIDPLSLSIENKFRFESLFEYPANTKDFEPVAY